MLLRILLFLAGVGFMVVGVFALRRRLARHKPPITPTFNVLAGLALVVEAFTRTDAFGVVGGVMIFCAGLAAAFGYTQ